MAKSYQYSVSNKEKVLEQFFLYPTTELELREISRNIDLAPKSVKNYLEILLKEKLIRKKMHRVRKYPLYVARFNDKIYRFYKVLWYQRKLFEIGLIDFIYDEYMPDCIILFGSASRGEDNEESDIDIFIEAKRKGTYRFEFKLDKFNKAMKRQINPYFESDINNIKEGLRTNIINGVKLSGYLDIDYGKKTKRPSGSRKGKRNLGVSRKKPKKS